MRIIGAASCFESRRYDIGLSNAWDFICYSVDKMQIKVVSIDLQNFLIKAENDKKNFIINAKIVDGQTEVIIDATNKKPRAIGFSNDTRYVVEFFEYFEDFMLKHLNTKVCPECQSCIAAEYKYCPICGGGQA